MFGAELEDHEPEPDEEDDPAEDGEGWAPGRGHRRTAIYDKH
jgi:hypothetical protein